MKKRNKRWYEQKEHLSAFVNLLEGLEIEVQCEIAVDIIMKVSSMLDRKYENFINDIGEYDPKDYRRWYDKNPNIHYAIESIKELDEQQQDELLKDFTEIILKYYPEEEI